MVAPHVGAWIETHYFFHNLIFLVSLPMWERGLKPILICVNGLGAVSLPMWERGLKLGGNNKVVTTGGRSPCGSVD